MDFNDTPVDGAHLQGQLLTLMEAFIGLLHAGPAPASTWVQVSDHLDARITAMEADATLPPAAATGMRDMAAWLSMRASRPDQPAPG